MINECGHSFYTVPEDFWNDPRHLDKAKRREAVSTVWLGERCKSVEQKARVVLDEPERSYGDVEDQPC